MTRRIGAMLTIAMAMAGATAAPAGQSGRTAAGLLDAAVQAIGGEARLKALRTLKLETMAHQNALEQSERPEGPWLAQYFQRTETRDLTKGRLRRLSQTRDWSFPQWTPGTTTIVADGVSARTNGQRWTPGMAADLAEAAETFALSPERLLLTARSAPDVRVAPERTLQGVPQDAVAFTFNSRAMTLYLNRWTHLPTMLEVIRPDTWEAWGDVTEHRWYTNWELLKGGLWYPHQTTVDVNGMPHRTTMLMAMTVDEPVDDTAFEIPEETRKAFAAQPARAGGIGSLRLDTAKVIEVTPSIVQYRGTWDVIVVRQPDGLVILDAPISAQYTADVIAAAQQRFPGAPIKAVVTTSDAWPHIGGVREYVARRVPLYALDLNLSILNRLVKAPRTIAPDALARIPVAPSWRTVAAKTTIGTGDTRMEIYPVRGETGERMMVVWIPGASLLYSSDLIQRTRPDTFFMPGMLAEVIQVVEREKVGPPKTVVGMHLPPTPWEEIVAAVDAVKK